MFNQNAKVGAVKCINGHDVPFTVGDGTNSRTLTCPTCGQKVTLQGDKFKAGLEEAERKVRDAFKNLKL